MSINSEVRLCVLQEISHALTKALLREEGNTYSASLLQELLSSPMRAYFAALPLMWHLQFPTFGWLYFHGASKNLTISDMCNLLTG